MRLAAASVKKSVASPVGRVAEGLHNVGSSTKRPGQNYGGVVRLADWDGDGDMDVLVADNATASLVFYERFPDETFQKHELIKFPAGVRGFEIVDWDGDLSHRLFDV